MLSQNRIHGDLSRGGVVTPGASEAAGRLLTGIRDLAPEITARLAEIDSARRVPPDLMERLRSIGLFRMFAPRSLGGLELDLPLALEVIAALGKIDGSVGWTTMIGTTTALFMPLLPPETYAEIYRRGPDVIVAGSAQPAGAAEAVAGGWRVNGRWPFASGCQHADWMFGFGIVTEQGSPTLRGFMLPARDWQIEDTWHAAGLKGTGSHHIVLRDAFVPAGNVFDVMGGLPCQPGPLYQSPLHVLPLTLSAICVGMAEGALGEIVDLANTGRQQLRAAVPMRESETFQGELGQVAAEIRAARSALEVQAASHWQHALAGTLKDEALLIQGTQMGIWIAATCVRAADTCFALGGGSAVYESSPLQRRLRDLHVAAQHAVVHKRHYANAGKLLLERSMLPHE